MIPPALFEEFFAHWKCFVRRASGLAQYFPKLQVIEPAQLVARFVAVGADGGFESFDFGAQLLGFVHGLGAYLGGSVVGKLHFPFGVGFAIPEACRFEQVFEQVGFCAGKIPSPVDEAGKGDGIPETAFGCALFGAHDLESKLSRKTPEEGAELRLGLRVALGARLEQQVQMVAHVGVVKNLNVVKFGESLEKFFDAIAVRLHRPAPFGARGLQNHVNGKAVGEGACVFAATFVEISAECHSHFSIKTGEEGLLSHRDGIYFNFVNISMGQWYFC